MNIPIPTVQNVNVPLYLLIPIIWFILLWTFRIIYFRCECGALYHTEKEKKELINFFLFTFLSSGIIMLGCDIIW